MQHSLLLEETARLLSRLTRRSWVSGTHEALPFEDKRGVITRLGKEYFPSCELLYPSVSEGSILKIAPIALKPPAEIAKDEAGVLWHSLSLATGIRDIFPNGAFSCVEPAPSQQYRVAEQLPIESYVGAIAIPLTALSSKRLQKLSYKVALNIATNAILAPFGQRRVELDYAHVDTPFSEDQKAMLPILYEQYLESMKTISEHPNIFSTYRKIIDIFYYSGDKGRD